MKPSEDRWIALLVGFTLIGFGLFVGLLALLDAAEGDADAADLVALAVLGGGLVAAGLWACVVWPRRAARREAVVQARLDAHGGAPWAVRADWVEGRISSTTEGLSWRTSLLVTVATLGVVAAQGGADGWPGPYLVAFALTVAAAGGYLARAYRTHRLGEAVLTLSTLPARPGGRLEGTVSLSAGWRSVATVRLRVACLAWTYRGSTEGDGPSSTTHWSDTSDGTVRREGARQTVAVSVALPATAPVTGAGGDPWHEWLVTVATGPSPLHPSVSFEVPVFAWVPPGVAAS